MQHSLCWVTESTGPYTSVVIILTLIIIIIKLIVIILNETLKVKCDGKKISLVVTKHM